MMGASPNFEATLADLLRDADRPIVLHLVTGSRVVLPHEDARVDTGVLHITGDQGRTAIAIEHIVSAFLGTRE